MAPSIEAKYDSRLPNCSTAAGADAAKRMAELLPWHIAGKASDVKLVCDSAFDNKTAPYKLWSVNGLLEQFKL